MEKLIVKFTNCVFVQTHFNEIEIVKIGIGLSIFLENITKAIIILLAAYIVGVLKISLIIIAAYALLRYFAFGIHAKSSMNCLLISLLQDVFVPLVLKGLNINQNLMIFFALVFCLLIKKYAPADTDNHPLYNVKVRKELNCKATILSCFVLIATFLKVRSDIVKWILLSELYVVIGILPITYKLLKRRYKNYEKVV